MNLSVRHRFFAGISSAALIGLVAGCGSTAASGHSPSTPASGAKSPYVIHAIMALTGSASFLGKEEDTALKAFEQQVNQNGGIDGHPLQFDIQDNESNPATAVSLAGPLIAQHIPVLLNGSVVATDIAVDKLATTSGPVIYDLSPGVHPAANSFIYSSSNSTTSQMTALLNYLRTQKMTRIAAITSNDASGQDGWNQLQAAMNLPQNQGKFTMLTHQTFGDTDVSAQAQLAKIAANHPQAIIAWSTGTPIETVFKGLSGAGLSNTPIFTTDGNATYAEMQQFASFLPNHLYFPTPPYAAESYLTGAQKTAVDNFFSAFKSMNITPDNGEALSWDPAHILVHVIRKLGVKATATQIQSAINNLSNFPGVDGAYNFSASDHRGLSEDDIYISEWSASKHAWEPASGPGGLGKP